MGAGAPSASLSVHRTAPDLARMRRELGRIRLAGATWQRLRSSRPRGPRVWPDENKAGVRGDCQTGGAKTIAIKGTCRRTAAQSCLGVRLSWDGSRLLLQTPNPPGPGAPPRYPQKPWLSCPSLDAMQIPRAPTHGLGPQGHSGTWIAAAGREDQPARSPAFTFRRAAWESAARRPLAVPSAPASVARSRQREPALWAPPPDARPRPRAPSPAPPRRPTTAGSRAGPVGFSRARCGGDEAAAAAPAATSAVFATAAEASSRRPKCPELSRGSPHNRG